MRVHGLLSWYDESPVWLATAVAGFARVCDTIVAVDGAYALFPKAKPRSHPQQVEAIMQTAEAQGAECIVHQPQGTWRGNEVGKRGAALALAATIAEDGDWVLVFDADYHVLKCNPEAIRWDLEHAELDVATYTLLDEWKTPTRDIFRWSPGLQIGPTHACYSNETGWLKGPHAEIADAFDLGTNLTAYHRTADRSESRRKAAEHYYKTRDMHGIENVEELAHGR